MKKILSILLSFALAMSMVACGEIEKMEEEIQVVDIKTALHSSPEQNTADSFYSKVLKNFPEMTIEWSEYMSTAVVEAVNADDVWDDSITSKFILEQAGITMEEYLSLYGADSIEDLCVATDGTEITTFTNGKGKQYAKYMYEHNMLPEPIMTRIDWEKANQFQFAGSFGMYHDHYLGNDVTINFLDVPVDIDEDYKTNEFTISLDLLYEDLCDVRGDYDGFNNKYFGTYREFESAKDPERLEFKDGKYDRVRVYTDGPYDFFEADDNIKRELELMKETVQKYLEQKYTGVDNGIEFSDYMLKYANWDKVKKYTEVQGINKAEIKDVVIYANPLSFHPFVDVEYTLTINGEDYNMHEIYFLEIDKTDSGEFVYKIAYVADYTRGRAKFNYTVFRGGDDKAEVGKAWRFYDGGHAKFAETVEDYQTDFGYYYLIPDFESSFVGTW